MVNTIKRILFSGMLIMPTVSLSADYSLLFQSSDYRGEKNFEIQEAWLRELEKASNGRLEIELLPNGGIVDNHETLDAMRLGLLDGHLSATGYFSKKDPAFGLMGNTVGAWSDTSQFLSYMYEGGGNQLMEKLYAKYNVKYVGAYTSGVEAFVSKIPIDGVDDFKGVKMRSPDGLVTSVFAAIGAEPIALPGSQIIAALEKGTIDAADYSVFSTNQSAGMNDVATHPIQPGFHSLPALDFSMSQKKWDILPADIQDLMSRSVRELARTMTTELKKADIKAIEEAQKNPNITIHDWSSGERKKFRAVAQDQWKVVSEKSPNAKLVFESITKFLKENNLL